MAFAYEVIRTVRAEQPQLCDARWSAQVREMLGEAVECETAFAADVLAGGVAGLSVAQMREYLEYIADLRLQQLGEPLLYGARNPFPFMELQDVQAGDQAGISKATILIKGENAYGYAKAERGVHRLVRISPFDANKRRHTSFCAVDVIAEVNDEIAIDIPEAEIRVDVYRSSGKGGQGVNTTDSAVRLTHIPSGIVVVCQNERSQIKNRATALNVLKSRLYEKKQDEQRAEMDKFYGEKGEIGWGSQIRSYVLQPYQMVKDLRTGISTSDTQGVLDGDLDRFVNAWLRAGCPRHRNKDIQMEE